MEPHGYRIAVIENEFGRGLGIESAIAKDGTDGSSLEGFFELANGCICCSVKRSVPVLAHLLKVSLWVSSLMLFPDESFCNALSYARDIHIQ